MSQHPLQHKNIILGVTGSIAAYKAADLASKLAQSGAIVNVVLTDAATQFIAPLTFQSVTGQPAYTNADLWGANAHVLHIGLARKADALLIAPATANTLAKLAHGRADDLICLTALALGSEANAAPLMIAPAMDAGMYTHTATQENVAILTRRGVVFIGPEAGHLASGLIAKGRMSEPAQILARLRYQLSRRGPLQDRHITVTAGPTQEDIDPVRYLSNRSTGKQGHALAQAALDAGADVTLISGPTQLPPPAGATLIKVRTALEMEQATLTACKTTDALLMSAAVADFRPAQPAQQKIKKITGAPSLPLAQNPDILAAVHRQRATTHKPKILVGFAAETQDLIANAAEKMRRKGLNFIVANDVSASDAGFAVDTNRALLLHADGRKEELPLMSKYEIGAEVIARVIALLNPQESS
jgi:phosphopantothenoylcysteine decarboxylase / phosphopantothenate---cysteine ligase